MLVAQQKLEENIAEYILYMYQIEDVIRACNFDIDVIINQIVRPQLPDESFLPQYIKWYKELIRDMQDQRITKTGHLLDLNEILVELSFLHNTLVTQPGENKYKALVDAAQPNIQEFKQKSNLKDKNDIELLFGAMYMKLLMRLQKKEISPETEEAFDSMRIMLAYLSQMYHKMKNGDMDFLYN
jgi:hypothetical protein